MKKEYTSKLNTLFYSSKNRKINFKLLGLLLAFGIHASASAQWNTNGDDIHNSNTGNVGVGTATPSTHMEVVNGTLRVSGGNSLGDDNARLVVDTGPSTAHSPLELRNDDGVLFKIMGGTGKVGIGTATPAADLHIIGGETLGRLMITPDESGNGDDSEIFLAEDKDGTYGMSLKYDGGKNELSVFGKDPDNIYGPHLTIERNSGNIGIGTANPQQELHIKSKIGQNASIRLESPEDNMEWNIAGGNKLYFARVINGVYHDYMTVNSLGNISIGTAKCPSGYKLSVDGGIIAERLKIKLSQSWPDYVFSNDYNLKNLSEVESFIKMHNHLPDVPSEKEVIEKGIDVGEMHAILLQKIEELTLYTIKQQKELDVLRKVLK